MSRLKIVFLPLFTAFSSLTIAPSVILASTVAILGDSISTGAVSHPSIAFDAEKLEGLLSGKVASIPSSDDIRLLNEHGFASAVDFESPSRAWLSIREFDGGLSWILKHLQLSLFSSFIDVEEYSWGNLLSRKLGVAPKQILIAAENGARMAAAKRQLDRVLDVTRGIAPEHLFVFFTGNDLCGPTMSFVTGVEDYEAQVNGFLSYLEKNALPYESGSHIWLLDPIGALQLTYSKDIQDKVVEAHGKKMTCHELHNLSPGTIEGQEGILGFIPNTPAGYCPLLLTNKTEQDREQLVKLSSRILGYRDAIGRQVAKFKKKENNNKFNVHHVTSTGRIVLKAEDIAEDCFHLSLAGQVKVAKTVLNEMKL